MLKLFDKDGMEITATTEYCTSSSCLGEPWCSAWGICQQSADDLDHLFSQVEMDFLSSAPDRNKQGEPISSGVPTPSPAFAVSTLDIPAESSSILTSTTSSKAPSKKQRIFAPLKSDEDVIRARNEGTSKKTASDTRYCLSLWNAWVNYREKENGDSIGSIENLTKASLQPWLTKFILEVNISFFFFYLAIYSNFYVFHLRLEKKMDLNFHPILCTM